MLLRVWDCLGQVVRTLVRGSNLEFSDGEPGAFLHGDGCMAFV